MQKWAGPWRHGFFPFLPFAWPRQVFYALCFVNCSYGVPVQRTTLHPLLNPLPGVHPIATLAARWGGDKRMDHVALLAVI